MIDMEDKSMIFTLNGVILITNTGSELCFADFEVEDGEFVVCELRLITILSVYNSLFRFCGN